MTAVSATTNNSAKNGSANSCDRNRDKLRLNLRIVDAARKLFPVKTAPQLVELTGYPLRTVEYWMTGKAKIPSDAIAMLLRSEFGREFLLVLMGDARPGWWAKALSYFAMLDALALTRRAKRKIREALDADAETTRAIERADALLVHDADFYGENASAVQSMARLQNRAVAPATKDKR